MRNALILSALGLMISTSVGCDFTQKFCDRSIDCMGDEYYTADECVTASNTASADAEAVGCGDAYDDASKCAYKNAECTTEDLGLDDGSTYELYSAGSICDAENEVYITCMTEAALSAE